MIQVNVNNLEDIKNRIICILGKEFINEINSFHTIGLKQSEAEQIRTKAHPLAIWWQSFKQDITNSQKDMIMRLSEYSIRLIDLISDLEDIKMLSNHQRILNSIHNKGTFYSACFEAKIAANYVNMDKSVEIQKEGIVNNQRVSDLRINTKDGLVFLECKSLDDFKLKESPLWNQTCYRIQRILERYKKSLAVTIFAGKQITGKDMDQICTRIGVDIRKNCFEDTVISNYFKVNYKKVFNWDQKFYGPFSMKRMTEIGSVEAEVSISPCGVQVNQNCTMVQVIPYTDFDISKRLIHEFKKAIGQVPKSGPGIIHIEVPYKQGKQLLKVIDTVYPKIYKKLNMESSRINAVVISGTVVEASTPHTLLYNYYVVPNNNPCTTLPNDFSLVGTHDLGIPLSDKEGTVEFTYKLPYKVQPGVPAIIFKHCSKTGMYQFSVWKTWEDKLRMDIVTPSLGRVFVEAECECFAFNSEYKFAGTWSNKEIAMYINGVPQASKFLNLKK
jgi:hypothetical protein